MISIEGDEALSAFRANLTGNYGLDLVRQYGGRVLIQFPVGVGKSRWIDEITVEAVRGGGYDLVVVLCPTRQLIEERGPNQSPPAGLKVVNLRPRPSELCGAERDELWGKLESSDLGAFGRAEVCGACPHLQGCFWPGQYGKPLEGARIIYATQAHLAISPGFLENLRRWAGAERMLTLLDEADFIGSSTEKLLTAEELDRFRDALEDVARIDSGEARKCERWLHFLDALRNASTPDLQVGRWKSPFIDGHWAASVQRAGIARHGEGFRFPAYRLALLGNSPAETRRRGKAGRIEFAVLPLIGDCMIFSGTTDLAFARHRLGMEDLASGSIDLHIAITA